MHKIKKYIPLAKAVLMGVLAAIGIYVIYNVGKSILSIFGVNKTLAEEQKEKDDLNHIDDYVSSQTAKLTKSVAEWNQIADTIYNSLNKSFLDNDIEVAGLQICRVQNDMDVAQLTKSFGMRQDYSFGMPIGKPNGLEYFVTKKMPSKVSAINNNYVTKKIKKRY